jgi:hypothetical protein
MLQRVLKVSTKDEKLKFFVLSVCVINETYEINNFDSKLSYLFSTNEKVNLFFIDCIFISKGDLHKKRRFLYFIFLLFVVMLD